MNILRNFRGYYKILGVRGVLFALVEKIIKSPMEVMVTADGIKYPFSLRLNTSDIPTYKQVLLDKEYEFELMREPKLIIDAGANIGLSSIYFSNKYPHTTIIAIEPEKSNFLLLEKNIRNYPNVIPVQAALWSDDSMIDVVDPELGKWGIQVRETGNIEQGNTIETVRGVSISMLLKEHNLSAVDVLKIDIEGAEKEVFEMSAEWIDKVRMLIVELHDRLKTGCSRAFYNATNGFPVEWHKGELVYLAREEFVVDE